MFCSNAGWKIALVMTLLLSACGGGGGGGGSASSSSVLTGTAITVTSGNSTEIGAVAADAATTTSTGSTGGAVSISAAAISSDSKRTSLTHILQKQLELLSQQNLATHNVIAGASMTQNNNAACGVSGTVSYFYEDRDASGQLSNGDLFTMTHINCVEFKGHSAINGVVKMTLNSMHGMPGDSFWQWSLKVDFQSLIMDGEEMKGYSTMVVGSHSSSDINSAFTDGKLTVTTLSTGKYIEMADFQIYVTDKLDGSYTMRIDKCSVYSSSLNGIITLTTPTTLAGSLNNSPDNPTSGVILIKGANNSQMRLSAVNNTTAQLEVDADGNGTFDAPVTKTWAELEAL